MAIKLPFPSFLDDVNEKGLRKAVYEGIDSVVERVTAGMNIQDIREALRGEAPSRRPNPRLQPHADGFWLHMRPSYFHQDMTGLYPTFRLGWLSTYFIVFETITGIFLMIFYTPAPEIAYGNMINIMSNVPFGKFMRDMHRIGAEAMVIVVFLHMMRTFFTASYKKPRQFTWFTGVILLLVTMVLSFSGYLLPWDQLALWAVTIGASMVEAAPVIGEQLNLLVRGGPEMGANGLLRFYLLHVLVLPALLVIFTGVHYYKVIVHGHSLPPQKENIGEDTAKRVPLDKRVYFIPDVLTNELMWIAVTTFLMVVVCTWFMRAPLESHANPQVTPLHTVAPWYFLWIQGALKLGDKVFWGIIFPTIVFGFLAVMPYLDTTISRRFADRRIALSVSFVLLFLLVIMSYMGLPQFGVANTADSEVLHELIPDELPGLIRPIPYDQLVVGMYTTAQFDAASEEEQAEVLAAFNERIVANGQATQMLTYLQSQYTPVSGLRFVPVPADAPELKHVLEEFHHMLHGVRTNADQLNDSWGAIIITQDQNNLRRVDALISWNRVETEIGFAVLDEQGNPRLITQTVEATDAEGNVVQQVVPVRDVTGLHTYISANSDYFGH